MSDLRTMLWKEARDLLWSGGRSDWIRPLFTIGVLGILLPRSMHESWLELPPNAVLIVLYIPFMLIISFIGDAIAGERERHTLETLLASRISDRAILLSKVLVTVALSWGMAVFSLLLGALVVNLSQAPGPWAFYPRDPFAVLLALSLLADLLAASGGVLISLKSATVRQAAQNMLLALILLGLAVYGLTRLLPADLVAALTTSQMVGIVLLALALLDALLLAAALLSFRRSRLILG
jgi:ABC-2 type transport system permease protein